mgnify:FL=1
MEEWRVEKISQKQLRFSTCFGEKFYEEANKRERNHPSKATTVPPFVTYLYSSYWPASILYCTSNVTFYVQCLKITKNVSFNNIGSEASLLKGEIVRALFAKRGKFW